MVCGVFRATVKSCTATEPMTHNHRTRFLHVAVLGVTTSTRHHDPAVERLSAPDPQRPSDPDKLGLRFGNTS